MTIGRYNANFTFKPDLNQTISMPQNQMELSKYIINYLNIMKKTIVSGPVLFSFFYISLLAGGGIKILSLRELVTDLQYFLIYPPPSWLRFVDKGDIVSTVSVIIY